MIAEYINTSIVELYLEASDGLLRQAKEELAKGDLRQAKEKAWEQQRSL